MLRAVFVSVFGFIGVVALITGIWLLGNRLWVRIDDAGVHTRRFLYGMPVGERLVARDEAMRLVAIRGGSVSRGAEVTVFYRLAVRLRDGTDIGVGDGLRGYGEARRAAETIASYTGLAFTAETVCK